MITTSVTQTQLNITVARKERINGFSLSVRCLIYHLLWFIICYAKMPSNKSH